MLLTATDLRSHLTTKLVDLFPWSPDYARSFFGPTGILSQYPPPDDDRFWAVIAAAEEHERLRMGRADHYARDCLRYGTAAPDGTPWPLGWSSAALNLLGARDLMRGAAHQDLARESQRQRSVWEEGHEECPRNAYRACRESQHQCGLTNFVHADGMREKWVQDAIAALRQAQTSENRAERRRATAILKASGEALWKVGGGLESELTSEERRARKAQQNVENGVLRTLRKRFRKYLPIFKGDRETAINQALGADDEGSRTFRDLDEEAQQRVTSRFREWVEVDSQKP
jgi:hypothetical protein